MQFASALPPVHAPLAVPFPPTTELELVERDLPQGVTDGIRAYMASSPPNVRVQVAAADLEDAFRAPAGRLELVPLCLDVAMLGKAYAACTGVSPLDVRLEIISDNACRAFHRDNVDVRLIPTYAGPGTQYVADVDADEALRKQQRFTGPVRSCPMGAIAWMRGSAADGHGLVHRSPPIAGSGRARLVLVISQPSTASPAMWSEQDGSALR